MAHQLLKDRCAVITGGTSGIGEACALRFVQEGARVAIFGRNRERGEALERSLQPGQLVFKPVDLRDREEVAQAVQEVLALFGSVDILVNNAGITQDGLFVKMTEEDWDCVMDTNAKSSFLVTHALIRQMIRARRGRIVNISSVVGLTGNAGQVNYAASKAAVIGFAKALAKEVATRNILVNCIAPGFIETPMTEKMTDAQRSDILSQIPLKRFGLADEVADVALFFASSLSNYITGQVLTVDGGMVM